MKLFVKMRTILEVWQLDADDIIVSEHTADLEEIAKYWVTENLHPATCKPFKVLAYQSRDFNDRSKLLLLASNDKYVAMLIDNRKIQVFDSTDMSKLGQIKGRFAQHSISDNLLFTMTMGNKIVVYDVRDRTKIFKHKCGIDARLVNFEMDQYVQVLLENQFLISFNPFEKAPENPCGD